MHLTAKGFIQLIKELKAFHDTPLLDLFRIRDALMILKEYGMEDRDLLIEVEKYIKQQQEK